MTSGINTGVKSGRMSSHSTSCAAYSTSLLRCQTMNGPNLVAGWSTVPEARGRFLSRPVCSRWRRLAISMSSLWTYIAIAIDTVRTEVPADRILEQLRRSKNLPLDILLRLEDAPPSAHDGIVEVVTLLHGECHRLRRYEFWLPARGDIGRDPLPVMDPFQSPTPLLVSFSLLLPVNYDEIEWPEDARDTYFPHTPKLQHIELSRSSISCSPLFATFTNMVSLALWYSSFENFATMARMSAPTLQYLSLFEEWGDVPPTPPPIVFPALHTLLLRTANPVLRDLIVAPKLRHITLDGNALEIELCPFLELVSSTVSHLTLSGNGLVDEVALVVRALDKVQHLTFSRSVAVDSYNVSDSLFEELASLTPTVWPKLQSIHFTEDAHEDSEELGAGLLRLVRARAPVPTASGSAATDPAQRTLTRVDIDTHAVPKWLRSTIDHILSSNNVAAVG
ncbi:hypothetical protein EXIGLDRAFT_833301 [Exidia glandulosa HHB12029]|uniref:F-box domain-containing protein n=1 Tax=Exidia glandulosa HHB12029 TaxID=1314781 RepID=A0A165KU05_EXIGL|nr:hypothetical protein EXIGLDRAFT_833301 [Exidia glandulosa HHB12029]